MMAFPKLSTKSTSNDDAINSPLEGVVACLTGLSAEQKDQYHDWIEALGGKYTRDFHTHRNTHLIASNPTGEKYETALACGKLVVVVKPSWIEACYKERIRVLEEAHGWKKQRSRKKRRSSSSPPPILLLTSLEQLFSTTTNGQAPNSLFSGHHFLLVGFDNQERKLLGKMLRRGMGTIHWEYQPDLVTHVLVHDHSDDALRASISKAKRELFGDYVTVVSPWWAVESWKNQEVQSPHNFPPQLEPRARKTSKSKKVKKEPQNQLFRFSIFVLLRVSNPPPHLVDYDTKELELLISNHSGQLLSLPLLETLRAEHMAGTERRTIQVVCFGGALPRPKQQFALHPLLTQIQRKDLCDLCPVTPNWLKTCVAEQTVLDAKELPLLFQSQAWPWRKMQENSTLRISVTGFQGAKRTALVQAIQALGALYDDGLHQNKTTHLIGCRHHAPNNQKFLKAQEWGIPIVSEEWLYHVLQHGSRKDPAAQFAVKIQTNEGS